ncbi:sigma-70 family RNA polymerase sigma factor [Planctomycetota bacterium]|nr:sigma-70 family RNA polymerase sigma factor [Planctomycetota bacterium]
MQKKTSPESLKQYTTETLFPVVYDALRELATYQLKHRQPGHSISGTELVHEVYLRLSKIKDTPKWNSPNHFFSVAAEAMRRILIDRLRAKKSLKRGGDRRRIEIDPKDLATPMDDQQLIEINAALDDLAVSDPNSADLIKMRFFVGMTIEQIAKIYGVTGRTITRRWAYARAQLVEHMSEDPPKKMHGNVNSNIISNS